MTIAWVLGSGGLLGSALCSALQRTSTQLFVLSERLKWTPKTGQQFKWDTVTRNGVNHDRDKKAQRTPAGAQSQGRA